MTDARTFHLVWDARSFKSPVSIASNLSSLNPETNVIYSPDERFILTGTAGPKAGVVPGKEVDVRGKRGGRIVVMKKENLEVVRELSKLLFIQAYKPRMPDTKINDMSWI